MAHSFFFSKTSVAESVTEVSGSMLGIRCNVSSHHKCTDDVINMLAHMYTTQFLIVLVLDLFCM